MKQKTKIPFLLLGLAMAAAAFAEKELTLGEYAAEVRERVVRKIGEALKTDGVAEVSGTVTFVGDGELFLQRDDEGLKILADAAKVEVGDEVKVSGAPSLEGGRVVFVAKEVRRLGKAMLPEARSVGRSELVNAGRGRKSVNWLRVSLVGRTIGKTENGFAVKVGEVPVNVMIPTLPDFLADSEDTHPTVRIVGVAELMLDQSALLKREGYVIGVKVNVSRAEDVELRPDAAYLAARHERTVAVAVAAVIVLLAIGLVAFAVVVFRQRRGMFRTRTIMAERKRMADDIHDTIEQHLVGAGMLLKVNRLAEAQEVLVRAKREIRDIVWGLKNDDMMRLSPAEMLRKLAHEENIKGIYRVDTSLKGLPEKLDAAAMRDLSLIVRETIGNAVKHGGAKRIAISSEPQGEGGWLLRISNDGEPFDPATAPGAKEGHFGIEGMKQRARRIGAAVTIERRGKGMVLNLLRAGK